MKINFTIPKRLQCFLSSGAALAGILLLSGAAANAQPFASPVGTTWDVNLSGDRSGVGLVDFAADGTFTMTEFIVPNPHLGSSSSSSTATSRNLGGGDSRTGTGGGTTGTNSGAVEQSALFGFETTSGRWGFNSQGNLIGFFSEISGEICTTNEVVVTNSIDGTITTNENRHCTATTNEVSFTGKVVTGARLTLNATTGGRHTIYQGLPFLTLTNIAGDWYGNRIKAGQNTTEFFTLTLSTGNRYDVSGGGGNYSYSGGVALLSRWKKIAFVLPLDDGVSIRATVGSFNSRRISFVTQGWEQPTGPLTDRVRFTGTRFPPVD